jgi:hypothetical protein
MNVGEAFIVAGLALLVGAAGAYLLLNEQRVAAVRQAAPQATPPEVRPAPFGPVPHLVLRAPEVLPAPQEPPRAAAQPAPAPRAARKKYKQPARAAAKLRSDWHQRPPEQPFSLEKLFNVR